MYTTINFKTKKELKARVEAYHRAYGNESMRKQLAVTYFQLGPFGSNVPKDGTIYVEGPHYPKPHTWYAECQVKDGCIVKVK